MIADVLSMKYKAVLITFGDIFIDVKSYKVINMQSTSLIARPKLWGLVPEFGLLHCP